MAGEDWTQLTPATSPSARFGHGMTYDNFNNQIVLFGGQPGVAQPVLNDTWTWDGTTWTQQFPATSPSARSNMGMAMDFSTGNVVMFGGADGSSPASANQETWTWDGFDWTLQAPATLPSKRQLPCMGYHIPGSRIIMYGGRDTAFNGIRDTWAWDGIDWTNMLPAAQPALRQQSQRQHARCSLINANVFFGGNTGISYLQDTWRWDNFNWTQLAPTHKPGVRDQGGLAQWTDGTTLLFGGFNGTQWLNDTWKFNGTDWAQQSPAHSPSARELFGLAYHAGGQYILLFGGDTAGVVANGETWIYHLPIPDYTVSLARGGVASIAPDSPTVAGGKTLDQMGMPRIMLDDGCTVEVSTYNPDGTQRTTDALSDLKLWVEDEQG